MTTLTDTQVITASGGLVELGYSQITTNVGVSSTTAGSGTPIISAITVVCDGSPVVVEFYCPQVFIKGSTTVNVSLYRDGSEVQRFFGVMSNGSASDASQTCRLTYRDTPTAGSHTYDVRAYYSGSAGSSITAGSGPTATTAPAFLRVSKIVQATQWPAVTTGTIICTSSTRPASPFAGQRIYQSDDKRELIYNGSSWVTTTPVSAETTAGSDRNGASSNVYDNLSSGGAGPSVTVATGTSALVTVSCYITLNAAEGGYVAPAVSGATTQSADDTKSASLYIGAASGGEGTVSTTSLITGLTSGDNTFTLKYRSNTTNTTVEFKNRRITVVGIP